MKTELHEVLLEFAKQFLRNLSKEDFLALTCDIGKLIRGLVQLVRNESAARNIDSTANTAQTFGRTKRQIRNLTNKKENF